MEARAPRLVFLGLEVWRLVSLGPDTLGFVGIDVEFSTEQRGKRKKHTFLGGDMRIPEPLALAASYLPGGRSLVTQPAL